MSKEKKVVTEEKKVSEENKLSRRSMLKWAAGLAAAGAVGIGVGYGADELLRSTVPPNVVTQTATETAYITVEKEQVFVNCGHNGPLNVAVRNGRIIRIDPFETPNWQSIPTYQIQARGKTFKPTVNKSLMSPWHQVARRYVYSTGRLLYPMKRVGYTPGGKGDISNRGKGEFVRISWDEALNLITSEMERLRTTYGLGAINVGGAAHYQTRGAFCDGIGDARSRFMALYSQKGPKPPDYPVPGHTAHAGNWNHSWIGWASAPDNMVGYYWEKPQIWPADDLLEDTLKNSNMVIYWAEDPTSTEQMYRGYEYEEYFRWFTEAGIKTLGICPNLNESLAFHCDKWMPVYPGYDIPLQLAIAQVWFTENTWDKAWVATHAVGMDKFQDYVMGTTDSVPKTPEWAEKLCGVKARDIRALAREWAKGPVFVMCNNGGANRGWNGDDWARMIITLQTMQGNIGKPGGNLNGTPMEPALTLRRPATGRTGVSFIFPRIAGWPIHFHPCYTVWAECIENGNDKVTKWVGGTTGGALYWKEFTMEHMYPYPGVSEVKMLGSQAPGGFNVEGDWFVHRAKPMMSPKIEQNWVATINANDNMCRYADILLPICTNFERVDITSIVNKWFVYMQKCIEPLGESISDMELFLRLAKKLGFGDTMYQGWSEEQMAQELFKWSHGPNWITWEDLKKQGGSIVPYDPKIAGLDKIEYKPAMNWYYIQPKGSGLTTPTGMIEIYHQPFFDAYGENGPISAIPKWKEPKDGKGGPLATKYPLLAHIAHFKWRFHSQFDQVSWLREMYKIKAPDGKEYEPIRINPQTAAERGIKQGDVLKVSSNWGEMLCAAKLTERTRPGVLIITYGAWADPVNTREKSVDRGGNANSIMSSEDYKGHNQQIDSAHVMVQIEKVQ